MKTEPEQQEQQQEVGGAGSSMQEYLGQPPEALTGSQQGASAASAHQPEDKSTHKKAAPSAEPTGAPEPAVQVTEAAAPQQQGQQGQQPCLAPGMVVVSGFSSRGDSTRDAAVLLLMACLEHPARAHTALDVAVEAEEQLFNRCGSPVC